MSSPYDYTFTTLDGQQISMDSLRGKVLLIVNTASKCGFTPQYQGLEELHKTYAARGLVVLGFPCNQFGKQEPGDSAEISNFCEKNYGVTFTISEKIDVNGDNAHPLFQHLKAAQPGLLGSQGIKWNFTKFLVNRRGEVVDRYAPTIKPQALVSDIEAALEQSN